MTTISPTPSNADMLATTRAELARRLAEPEKLTITQLLQVEQRLHTRCQAEAKAAAEAEAAIHPLDRDLGFTMVGQAGTPQPMPAATADAPRGRAALYAPQPTSYQGGGTGATQRAAAVLHSLRQGLRDAPANGEATTKPLNRAQRRALGK